VNYLHKIARDATGIAATCGWWVAVRWLFCIASTLPECIRTRNLQPADRRMGDGPFIVTRRRARAKLCGRQVFSGLREIWVRDVYLKNDFLEIPNASLVVDLGANIGNFTNLALIQHDNVRVIAVEPSLTLLNTLRSSIDINGWSDRVVTKRGFIGMVTKVQVDVTEDPDYRGAPFISEKSFLEEFKLQRIDLLKCDIEGSEFFMLQPESKLLSLTARLAIEIHPWGGSVQQFLTHLRAVGFEISSTTRDTNGCCIALCRNPLMCALDTPKQRHDIHGDGFLQKLY
jgi:FkbM family methyltransferase